MPGPLRPGPSNPRNRPRSPTGSERIRRAKILNQVGPPSESPLDNSILRKADLIDLCTQYQLPTDGTVPELRERITKFQASQAEALDSKRKRNRARCDSDDDDPEDQWALVWARARTRIDVSKQHALWSDVKSILTPGVWPWLLFHEPLTDADLDGWYNLPGDTRRGMLKIWVAKWGLTPTEAAKFGRYLSLRLSLTVTGSSSGSVTQSRSSSSSLTASLSGSLSPTSTPSLSLTPSETTSGSASLTESQSSSGTASASRSPSESGTASVSGSESGTASASSTTSETRSGSTTASNSESATRGRRAGACR